MKLKDYITEYVSSGRGRLKVNPLDIDSTVEDITSFLESLGFTKMKRITSGIPKNPQYAVEPAKLTEGYAILFKFFGNDRRLYWGEFKTGNFPLYSRLLDVTDNLNPIPVVANANTKYAKENIDEITILIKKLV